MNSLTLLELLRRRSALPVGETWRLLGELPRLLDDAERLGELPVAHLLGTVQVVFESGAQGDCAGRPVGEWSAFHLDLIADETQSETAVATDPPEADGTMRFAALLYEMLGGPHRSDGARPPLAAVGEEANRVFQRALAGGADGSCAEFWREFQRASAGPQRIPDSPPGCGTRGDLLMLTPNDGGMRIRLVARTEFRIGRSRAEADLLTRFLPETPENATRTHELGRVQVLGEIIGGEPALRDGNGTRPSANGSTFDGHPLDANSPRPVRQRGVLDLAGRFSFEVIPQFAAAEDFAIENLAAWKDGAARSNFGSATGMSPLLGAVTFAARAEQPFVRDAVWLFTRVDFSLGENDALVWLPPSRNNPAAFLRSDGGFWIVNAALPAGRVHLDKTTLAPGDAAPLVAGASLRLNTREFALEIT